MLDEQELNDFPELTIDYLREITAGIFQIKLAPSYVQDKLQRDEHEVFQVEMMRDVNRLPEAGFMRVRVYSRYRNQTRYQLWISYLPNVNVENRTITGYYCTCKTGNRTLGTCVHVTSVLWYLGFAKLQENVSYPSNNLLDSIIDAGNRQPQENPP